MLRLCFILWILSISSLAQSKQELPVSTHQHFRFDNLTLKDGLSSKDISFVYQDKRGFIWIGTKDGLNRFDGINFKIYKHSEQVNSIIDNRLNSIIEENDGSLWIGTQGGVSHFNPFSEYFENFVHDEKDVYSLPSNWDCNVFKDSNHRIWITNNYGLFLFNRKTKAFEQHLNKHDNIKNFSNLNTFFRITEDEQHTLWLPSWNGVVNYDIVKRKFTHFEKTNSSVNCVLRDSQQNLWYGAWDYGVCLLNPVSGEFKKIPLTIKKPNEKYNVYGIKEIDQKLWVCSNIGLFIIPLAQLSSVKDLSQAEHYEYDFSNSNSLAGVSVNGVFRDRQGIIWVWTDGGISRIIPSKQMFQQIPVANKGYVTKLLFDEKVNLIGSWAENALIITDKAFKPLRTFKHFPPQLNVQANHAVNAIVKDKQGYYWIGTMNSLVKYNFVNNTFKIFQHDEKDTKTIAHRRITSLSKDSKGRLWVGLYDFGLDLLPLDETAFTHYQFNKEKANSLGDNLVWEILEDRKGRIWILGNACLSLFDEQTQTFQNFRHQKGNIKSLSGDRLSDILEDKQGRIWIGTDNGLNLLDERTQTFSHWTTDNGLVSNDCRGLQEDTAGNIWITTANGLSKFDWQKQKFFNFTELDGLAENIITGEFAKDPEGNLYIGYYGKMNKVNPSAVKTNALPPSVVITNLKVLDHNIKFDKSLDEIEKVEFSYDENHISFDFIAINYNNASKNQYAYRLEGLESRWNYVGNQPIASYSNLREGTYTFHVKAANNDGVWNETGAKLRIVIYPPFWRTWWFVGLMILLLCGLTYSFFRFRINQVRKQEAQKSAISEQITELRMKALRVQMNPHFMFNSLNAIQECVITGQTDAAVNYLAQFSKLMRLVLENSDKKRIPLDNEIETIRLYLDLEKLRFSEVFYTEISVNTHEDAGLLTIPPMMIQPFLENAIWHGLLKKQGEKRLIITISSDDIYLYIEIEDNGIGRVAAEKQKNQLKSVYDSKALNIIDERLRIITDLNQIKADFKIIDLYDDAQLPLGTRVQILIPV